TGSMRYAEVAVAAPVGHSRTFSYSIPEQFSVEPGQLVWVPFGRRTLQGVVVALAPAPQVEVTRDILQPVEPSPLVSPVFLELAVWMSRYYRCSLFDALALMLPPGFETQVRSQIIASPVDEAVLTSLPPQTQDALRRLAKEGRLSEKEFVNALAKGGERELRGLLGKGLVHRQVDLPRPRVSPRYECYLFPIDREGSEVFKGLRGRQLDLLRAVWSRGGVGQMALANKEFGPGVANALVEKGLVGLEWVRVEAGSVAPPAGVEPPLVLTAEQADALARITDTLDKPAQEPRSFLLHGITGSGKTEVYLQAMHRVVQKGQQALLLVPEIALTPQTLERVNARFPGRVGVVHSALTPRQRFDQWWNIQSGIYDVVVGPRSALFAPVPRLGLIVIDEEHEWTYKQEEAPPLYHARTVALKLAQLTGTVVVLGSATPDVETYYRASRGRHRLLELPRRIGETTGHGAPALPRVEVCDMRQELREGNRSIFSRRLAQSLRDCVQRRQQAILFLNRRGNAPIVQCRDCGYVVTCSRCSVSLNYHSTDARLVCHRCNRRTRSPLSCRQCGSSRIRQLGIGTQRVVDEVALLLPGVGVERWDSDVPRSGGGYEETLRRFASGETQVLVGTQLVAKGLHIPNVTLVGVVLADVGLYLPDFRAGERGFDLLCQVAGRAGRGSAPGQVIIQTYSPEHYAIRAAAQHDYAALYQQEIQARHQQGNPPFNQLMHLVYQDLNPGLCQRQAMATARLLRHKVYAQGLADVDVIGPAPGVPARLRGRYRWHLTLRGRDLHHLLEGVDFPPGCTVDVDPAHLL
ncbi:MAG: primosomal protein N', partial [Chloroflexota bacterium]